MIFWFRRSSDPHKKWNSHYRQKKLPRGLKKLKKGLPNPSHPFDLQMLGRLLSIENMVAFL
ncbi:uncharacterized protein METZ01_LOCUS218594 [marine metagenome]|uniref:Uncharacterized protein n=1 Tax=marine metagenome TaxID=408172 RepID=A0A382FRV5_9ZZZZ